MSTAPTEEQLEDLSLAVQHVFELDENRLTAGEDYALNLQGGKRTWQREDCADEKLFAHVSRDIWTKPTFLIFYHLLDNYEKETGVAETVTRREKKEMWDFLRAVMATPCMQFCHKYLVAKGHAEEDEDDFIKQLYQMWFSMYRRDGQDADSSGFEHVFVGESDEGRITGLHNWVQMYIEEARGNLDYKGFILPRKRHHSEEDLPDGDERLLTLQFGWDGEIKNVSTLWVGTSPEFEMAVYTMCFMMGETNNYIDFEDYRVNIKCYRIRSKYGDKVGTAFPMIEE